MNYTNIKLFIDNLVPWIMETHEMELSQEELNNLLYNSDER